MSYTFRWRALTVDPSKINVVAAQREVIDYMDRFMINLVKEVRNYPPPPGGSTYVRTRKLYGGWRVEAPKIQPSGAVVGFIYNAVEDTNRRVPKKYMSFVQGIWQTRQHSLTGWISVNDARAKMLNEYRRGLQAIYSKHIRL